MARREAPAKPGFRRRIPLELTAAELDLLEEAEARFGTKRATLVAGLEALARLDALEGELAKTTAACEKASVRATELETSAGKLEQALTKAKGEASSAKRGKESAERTGKKARAEVGAQAEDLARLLRAEQEASERLEEEVAALEEELFDALRCSRCGALAEPNEWATKSEDDRTWVFHRPCGFHRGGLLDSPSIFGFRARP